MPQEGNYWVVRPGENVFKIAENVYGNQRMAVEIARMNGIGSNWIIQPGERLLLPENVENPWFPNELAALTPGMRQTTGEVTPAASGTTTTGSTGTTGSNPPITGSGTGKAYGMANPITHTGIGPVAQWYFNQGSGWPSGQISEYNRNELQARLEGRGLPAYHPGPSVTTGTSTGGLNAPQGTLGGTALPTPRETRENRGATTVGNKKSFTLEGKPSTPLYGGSGAGEFWRSSGTTTNQPTTTIAEVTNPVPKYPGWSTGASNIYIRNGVVTPLMIVETFVAANMAISAITVKRALNPVALAMFTTPKDMGGSGYVYNPTTGMYEPGDGTGTETEEKSQGAWWEQHPPSGYSYPEPMGTTETGVQYSSPSTMGYGNSQAYGMINLRLATG